MNSRWHRGYFVFVLDRSSSFLPGIFLCLKPYNLTVSPTNDLTNDQRPQRWRTEVEGTNDLTTNDLTRPTTSEVANEVGNERWRTGVDERDQRPHVTSDPRGNGRTGVADAHGDRCK